MGLREFKLPRDFPVLFEVLPPSFQYPDHPEWSMQADELKSMVDGMQGIRRLWPVVRAVQALYPPLRDALRGYFWEEDGRAVGVANVLRMGATDQWLIANVSVLPEYRRRGIARQLVAASVAYARQRGATRITLDVVEGNQPAYALYRALGFDTIAREHNLIYEGQSAAPPIPLPPGYTLVRSSLFEWRPRYALAQRLTPVHVQRYKPVEEGRYRQPAILRPLLPLFMRATGTRTEGVLVRRAADGLVVGSGIVRWRTRPGGTNSLGLMLDPAHSSIAPALLGSLLAQVLAKSPGRRIELEVPDWQPEVLAAAQGAGFRERSRYLSMGVIPG